MINIAILAGWIIVMIALGLIYIIAYPFFYRIGHAITKYFTKNTIYKKEIEKNDPVDLHKIDHANDHNHQDCNKE